MFIVTEMVERLGHMMTLGLWIENVTSNIKGSSNSLGCKKVLKHHCNFERSQSPKLTSSHRFTKNTATYSCIFVFLCISQTFPENKKSNRTALHN